MIKINDKLVEVNKFPDGTMLLKEDIHKLSKEEVEIKWYYQNDVELVALIYLVKHLRANRINKINLYIPYLPNARQDRVKNTEDVFTLKYFSEILNDLKFNQVRVLDPHSTVSQALINNNVIDSPKKIVNKVIDKILKVEKENLTMFYPDEGASKRYAGMINLPYCFGIKKRDWKTGNIQGLDIAGDIENIKDKNILIVDDICSKGGTFYYSAKKLKELGAKNIYLYISHCEDSVLEGDLINCGLIKKIYTTNSKIGRASCRERV